MNLIKEKAESTVGPFRSFVTLFHRAKAERVDWLYSGHASMVNREEYLLGKKIDKMVDPLLMESEREKQVLNCDQ